MKLPAATEIIDRLLAEAQRGETYFKLYPRSEMHDDPRPGSAR